MQDVPDLAQLASASSWRRGVSRALFRDRLSCPSDGMNGPTISRWSPTSVVMLSVGELQETGQGVLVERLPLGGALDLDEPSAVRS